MSSSCSPFYGTFSINLLRTSRSISFGQMTSVMVISPGRNYVATTFELDNRKQLNRNTGRGKCALVVGRCKKAAS